MLSYQYRHRVRYRECDPMGFVYHTHYVDYFEAARTEALRHFGWPYRAIEAAGIIMPVIDLAIRYRQPARYDDLLGIRCTLPELPTTRLHMDYEVHRCGESDVLATGGVTLCFVDTTRNRPVRAPERLLQVLASAEEAECRAERWEPVHPSAHRPATNGRAATAPTSRPPDGLRR